MTRKRGGKKRMATQMAATPTLEGKDAQRLLDSLKMQTTEKSRKNAKKLMEYFKVFEEKGN